MSKKAEFLSFKVHPNIAAALLVAIVAGAGKFVLDTTATMRELAAQQQVLQQQIAEVRRALDRSHAVQITNPGR